MADGATERTPAAEVVPASPAKGFLRRERRLKELARGALRIYAANWPLWMVIGAAMIPASLLVMLLEQLFGLEWLMDLTNSTAMEPASEFIGMTLGALIGAAVVSVAVFAALREFDEGTPPSVFSVFRRVLDRGPSIVGQIVLYTASISLLSIVILASPWRSTGPLRGRSPRRPS